ncbi:MAG: SUMF1/EgtB/PvdO family nonheme iron enzyme, partial [Candidatus Brocadiia bacterium]
MRRRQGIVLLLAVVVGVLALSIYLRHRDPGYRVWLSLSPVRTDWTVSEVEEIVKKTPLRMVGVPAGEFQMGCEPNDSDGSPGHRVIVGRPFFIGVTEVTQAQYFAVVGENPSDFEGDNLPVVGLSWWHAYRFCRDLT